MNHCCDIYSSGYCIQISWPTGCLARASWWMPTGRWTWVAAWQLVERSIMSWQEGEGSDVLACPVRPAPVSLMRLPVTGDVVVRVCACARAFVRMYMRGCGVKQRLNKCIVSMTFTAEMSVILAGIVSSSLVFLFELFLRKITGAFVSVYVFLFPLKFSECYLYRYCVPPASEIQKNLSNFPSRSNLSYCNLCEYMKNFVYK